jgi:hypothetical protein
MTEGNAMTEQWRNSRWPPAAVGSHRPLPAQSARSGRELPPLDAEGTGGWSGATEIVKALGIGRASVYRAL